MRIEIPLFDGFDELDAVGPFEVLTNAVSLAGADWDVALVGAHGPGEVRGSHGLRVAVSEGLGSPDALVVPGGRWSSRSGGVWREVQEGTLPARLRELAPSLDWVASVCTGAMLLAAASLTDGRPATTHQAAIEDLRASGAIILDGARVVDDGDLLTAAGVTSGIDLALHLVERHWGADGAAAVAAMIEHPRQRAVDSPSQPQG
jgi:transcriptional regulator GlxA family with amidase domain